MSGLLCCFGATPPPLSVWGPHPAESCTAGTSHPAAHEPCAALAQAQALDAGRAQSAAGHAAGSSTQARSPSSAPLPAGHHCQQSSIIMTPHSTRSLLSAPPMLPLNPRICYAPAAGQHLVRKLPDGDELLPWDPRLLGQQPQQPQQQPHQQRSCRPLLQPHVPWGQPHATALHPSQSSSNHNELLFTPFSTKGSYVEVSPAAGGYGGGREQRQPHHPMRERYSPSGYSQMDTGLFSLIKSPTSESSLRGCSQDGLREMFAQRLEHAAGASLCESSTSNGVQPAIPVPEVNALLCTTTGSVCTGDQLGGPPTRRLRGMRSCGEVLLPRKGTEGVTTVRWQDLVAAEAQLLITHCPITVPQQARRLPIRAKSMLVRPVPMSPLLHVDRTRAASVVSAGGAVHHSSGGTHAPPPRGTSVYLKGTTSLTASQVSGGGAGAGCGGSVGAASRQLLSSRATGGRISRLSRCSTANNRLDMDSGATMSDILGSQWLGVRSGGEIPVCFDTQELDGSAPYAYEPASAPAGV